MLTYDEFTIFRSDAVWKKIWSYTQECIFPGEITKLSRDHMNSQVISSLQKKLELAHDKT